MTTVGFIGLGRMGKPMARNLVKAGFEVVVASRSPGPVEELAAVGARPARSPAEVAGACEFVLTCLPTPDVVEAVYMGPDGIVSGLRPGAIAIDHSTVGPATSRGLAAVLTGKGAGFLDAPVSGGPPGAEAGTLTIMVGGDAAVFERARPVLSALGRNIHHMGPAGAGSVTKLVNQLLVAVHSAAAAEAMVLGAKAGVDPAHLFEVLRTSFGQSRMLERHVEHFVLPRRFDAQFSIDLLLKDIRLATELGAEAGVRLLLGAVAQEVLGEARAMGLGELDASAVFLPAERLAGLEVRAHGTRGG